MSEPEISHRCPACGAAPRVRAQFCPQCGQPLKQSATEPVPAARPAEPPRAESPEQERKTMPLPPVTNVPPPAAEKVAEGPALELEEGNHKQAQGVVAVVEDKAPAKRERVSQAARGVVESNVRPRVDKLRQATNVVFEEASAVDPSLRFVLITAFLLIIFVILLLLSFLR